MTIDLTELQRMTTNSDGEQRQMLRNIMQSIVLLETEVSKLRIENLKLKTNLEAVAIDNQG